MKFLGVRELRGKSAQVWRELPREREMVISSNGRPIALLTAIGDEDLGESLAAWRRVRATQAIASIQRESVRRGTANIRSAEIDAEIAKTRRARRKRRP
jgi:antitoxin (DNA-binding transcriptional repressor) of toxin-antitoxin stability system